MLAADIQRRLLALGFDLGASGPDRDGVDGRLGALSQQAILAALGKREAAPAKPIPAPSAALPADWTPPARIDRIIVHWTAGAHKASGLDKAHYHILVDADGTLVRGAPSIALNDARGAKAGYAAHTLNCNTGSIGVALCCMAGAIERPFDAGRAPMTRAQWDALPGVLAALCARYGIAVTPTTVLSHAEVQSALGVRQRGKWDISRLPFEPAVTGATAVGDLLRARTAALLAADR